MRVADYVMERLIKEKVEYIYTVTGRGILYLTDALAKSELCPVCVHHEQAAAMAALGSASASGGVGVCLVSTGCGATNAMTGLLCAWQDDIPCIFISGQNMLDETVRYTGLKVKTYGSQETDIINMVESITKYAVMIENPLDIAYELERAIDMATTGRKGPVWIDIPLDIQNARVDELELKQYIPQKKNFSVEEKDIYYVEESLKNSRRPVLLLGSGVRTAEAINIVHQLIEKWNLPVVYASSAVDIYGAGYAKAIGAVGALGGTREGNLAVQNADFLFVLGCRLASITTGSQPDLFAREAKIVMVDIDPNEPLKDTARIDYVIQADLKYFLEKLMNRISYRFQGEGWIKKCMHWKEKFPLSKEMYVSTAKVDLYHLGGVLTKLLPHNGTIVCDAGYEELIIPSAVAFRNEQRCIHSPTQGAMGYALPTAIGSYLKTRHETVAVIGDGSMMMNLQELQTVVSYNIPLKILITNNGGYAVIRERQKNLFRTRKIGTDSSSGMICADYEKVANCFSIPYMKIENNAELEEKLKQVIEQKGFMICEIICEENQRYLHESYGRNRENKIVKKPIEDLSPFLSREELQAEMVIEMID